MYSTFDRVYRVGGLLSPCGSHIVIGLGKNLLFKSVLAHCGLNDNKTSPLIISLIQLLLETSAYVKTTSNHLMLSNQIKNLELKQGKSIKDVRFLSSSRILSFLFYFLMHFPFKSYLSIKKLLKLPYLCNYRIIDLQNCKTLNLAMNYL